MEISDRIKRFRKQIPEAVQRKVAAMDEINQEAFLSEFKKKSKSSNVACLLWLFGLHYAYFGKWLIFIIFWLSCGGFGIWWLIDIFRLHGMVRDHNKTAAIDVLKDIQVLA